jgi:hypothetical protein
VEAAAEEEPLPAGTNLEVPEQQGRAMTVALRLGMQTRIVVVAVAALVLLEPLAVGLDFMETAAMGCLRLSLVRLRREQAVEVAVHTTEQT